MNKYIESTKANFFGGILNQEIFFQNGLNIISGENGTGKTKLLSSLKINGILHQNDEELNSSSQIKVIAFSPKRNSQRRTVENIYEDLKRSNRKIEQLLNETLQRQVQDSNFENYPPIGELIAVYFEQIARAGRAPKTIIKSIETEFNKVLKNLLQNYKFKSGWDINTGSPVMNIEKGGSILSLNDLSCGEQEILSLIFNMYASRDHADVFLIDEPEVHLNWSLERIIFDFFNKFCKKYKKQIIAVTHSRVIFDKDFYNLSQFLAWDGNNVICRSNIDQDTKEKLAGEAVSIVQVVSLSKKTFFVEDEVHSKTIAKIAQKLIKDINITICGNKSNVKTHLNTFSKVPEYKNARYVIDGDGEGNPFPNESKLIHLKSYCMECYLCNIDYLHKTLCDSKLNVINKILEIIKLRKNEIIKHNKYLSFLIDRLTIDDITTDFLINFDCGVILNGLLQEYSLDIDSFIDKYVDNIEEKNLTSVFPGDLVEEIKNSGKINSRFTS